MTTTTWLTRVFRGPVKGTRLERVLRSIPALVWLVLIHGVSSVPGEDLPAVIDDRVAHFLEYFIFGVLLYFAAAAFDRTGRPWIVALGVVLFAATWGALDEFHQSFVPGRDSSLKDLCFDIAGASTASLLARWYAWRNVSR